MGIYINSLCCVLFLFVFSNSMEIESDDSYLDVLTRINKKRKSRGRRTIYPTSLGRPKTDVLMIGHRLGYSLEELADWTNATVRCCKKQISLKEKEYSKLFDQSKTMTDNSKPRKKQKADAHSQDTNEDTSETVTASKYLFVNSFSDAVAFDYGNFHGHMNKDSRHFTVTFSNLQSQNTSFASYIMLHDFENCTNYGLELQKLISDFHGTGDQPILVHESFFKNSKVTSFTEQICDNPLLKSFQSISMESAKIPVSGHQLFMTNLSSIQKQNPKVSFESDNISYKGHQLFVSQMAENENNRLLFENISETSPSQQSQKDSAESESLPVLVDLPFGSEYLFVKEKEDKVIFEFQQLRGELALGDHYFHIQTKQSTVSTLALIISAHNFEGCEDFTSELKGLITSFYEDKPPSF